MAKREIVPHKLVITCNEKGEFKDGIMIYQMKEGGIINCHKYNSISIKAGVEVNEMTNIFNKCLIHVKKSEKIVEG